MSDARADAKAGTNPVMELVIIVSSGVHIAGLEAGTSQPNVELQTMEIGSSE